MRWDEAMKPPKFSRVEAIDDSPQVVITHERRSRKRGDDDPVSRGEFYSYQREIREHLMRLNVALFAQDENNEHRQPGLMVTARRLDQHITAVCSIARWAKNTVIALATTITAVLGLAKVGGWF